MIVRPYLLATPRTSAPPIPALRPTAVGYRGIDAGYWRLTQPMNYIGCIAERSGPVAACHPAERRDLVTADYVRVTGLTALFAKAKELSLQTMIFDVEPLVAPWHSSQEALDQGVARILGDVKTVPSVRVVVFSTNSPRRPSALPACGGVQVSYLASADKPLRTEPRSE